MSTVFSNGCDIDDIDWNNYYYVPQICTDITKRVIFDLRRGSEVELWRAIDYMNEIEIQNFTSSIENFMWRSQWTELVGWSIPSKKAISCIKSICCDDILLSIGSGLGLWEFIMSNAQINVIASDNKIPTKPFFASDNYKALNAEMAIIEHPDANVLFVNWPYDFAEEALPLFKGQYVVSIGEYAGGCTGDIREILDDEDGEWKLIKNISILKWYGLHDDMRIYKR